MKPRYRWNGRQGLWVRRVTLWETRIHRAPLYLRPTPVVNL